MHEIKRLDNWFADQLVDLNCSPTAKAYITGVLSARNTDFVMSKRESIVLAFYSAKENGNFATFQKIGDWVLWVDSINPAFIKNHHEITETIARLSYFSCHRMLKGTWPIYEELADNLPQIVKDVRCKISQIK